MEVCKDFFADHEICGAPVSVVVPASGKGALLIANISGATDPLLLHTYSVRLVVQCAVEHAGRVTEAVALAGGIRCAGVTAHNIAVLELPMDDCDTFDISSSLATCLPLIAAARDRGEAALVNCAAGRSRSATVVIAHLMQYGAHTLVDAWTLLRSVRPFAYPNLGFTVQLMALEEEIRCGVCSLTPGLLRSHTSYICNFDEDEGQEWILEKLAARRAKRELHAARESVE